MDSIIIKFLKFIDYSIITYFQYKRNKVLIIITKLLSFFVSAAGLILSSLIIFYFIPSLFSDFFICGILSFILVKFLKVYFKRIRPIEYIYQDSNILKVDRYSFPSGHSTVAFSLCVILSYHFPDLLFIFIILAILISISRVYLLYHYLVDISAGAILGLFTGFFTQLIISPLLKSYTLPLITNIRKLF